MRSSRGLLGAVTVLGLSWLGACVGDDPVGQAPPATVDGGGSSSGSSSGASVSSSSSSGSTAPDAATSCPASLADCDDDGVCETAVATEPKHCGACGHDCQGGLCAEGRCLPQELASSIPAPLGIALSSSAVFWTDASRVVKCAKEACVGEPDVLARTTQREFQGRRQLFANDSNVYWLSLPDTTHMQIHACAAAGCSRMPTPIGEDQGFGFLVGNATSLFAYDSTGSLRKIDLGTGATTYMTRTYRESSFSLAVQGDRLAFSNVDGSFGGAKGVWLGSTDDATPALFMGAGEHLALNTTEIFTSVEVSATQDTVLRCAVAGCAGTGSQLFPSPDGVIEDLVADDTAVFWAVKASAGASDGAIRSCTLPDCAGGPRTLASNQAAPVALAIDGDFVYWANRGRDGLTSGSIQRVRR